MNLADRIQAKTDNGDTVIDFLVEVMQDERDGFKICHRLDSARLLTKYGCSCKSAVSERADAIDFILDNPPEPSRPRSNSGSSRETQFDIALAKAIRESTDDGDSVCRFLINVMEGELKAFGPQHSMAAARELLSRGFGKDADQPDPEAQASRPQKAQTAPHSSLLSTHSSAQSAAPHSSEQATAAVSVVEADTNQQPDPEEQERWKKIWEEITPILEEAERISAEQPEPEIDPDNPPHVPDYSAFDEAFENTQKWFEEWKNSIDPEEYQAVVKETSARFTAKIETRIQRRKQIAEDRQRRAKEEADRLSAVAEEAKQAKAKAESEPEKPPDPGPPPTRDEHKTWSPTPSIPTSFRLVKCGHPKCKLHDGPIYYPEDDRNSQYYFNGRAPPTFGNYPI